MPITLPELPYGLKDLEPFISARTLEFHHGKHHRAYVDNTNRLIGSTEFAGKTLEEIVQISSIDTDHQGLFNNAAQVWNHSFFWQCMKPGGGGRPAGKIAGLIDAELGGYETFVADFKSAGATLFGSGWVWLAQIKGALAIVQTHNAETPLTKMDRPLLVLDVWEHAYYLDYQNRRPDFIQAFLDHLVNWDFVNANLE